MNIFGIGIKNIKARPLSAVLGMVLFATGVFIISFLLLIKNQLTKHLEKNVAGINLVVGAKGSPMQLILSSIYHVDYPTGNISYDEAKRLAKHPLVARTVPLALGDNYKEYRIVGTTTDYADLYGGTLQKGTLWNNDLEVTIGAKVAEATGLKVGDRFSGVHGFVETEHSHDEFQYTVTGIFHKTGSVLDQLILTNIGSVWRIHDHAEEHDSDEEHVHDSDEEHEHHSADIKDEHKEEITALLVFYRNAMGAVSLPRYVNQNTDMQAASPAVEINRLFSLMGAGVQTIGLIAYLIIFISGLSVFVSLLNAMKDRKYELALMRVMGGSKMRIFALVIVEGLTITLIGFFIGILLSKSAAFGVSLYTEGAFRYGLDSPGDFKTDLILLLCSLPIGFAASVLPAIKAMKTDISETLSE